MYEKDEQAEMVLRGELLLLDLGGTHIGNDETVNDRTKIVADFLRHNGTVKKVNLAGCDIDPHGVEEIADAIKHNRSVEHLELSYNFIGEGAESLVNAFEHNVCICELLTEGYHIIPPEAEVILVYLAETRNAILIPAAVRRTSLYLITGRRIAANAGALLIFPKEIVKMIAMQVWATRKEPVWINALSESERTGGLLEKQIDYTYL